MVCGAKLALEIRHLKSRIKLQKGTDGTPVHGRWRKLLTHEIGRYAKETLPMIVGSFEELGKEVKETLLNHISVSKLCIV